MIIGLSDRQKTGYKKAIELLISEDNISPDEKIAYEKETRRPEIGEGEEVLTITREKYTLTDLLDYLNNLGYGRNKQTGSRIKGLGCGKNISNCVTWKMNSPLGRNQFSNMVSLLNTGETGRQMAGMVK